MTSGNVTRAGFGQGVGLWGFLKAIISGTNRTLCDNMIMPFCL